MTIRWATEAGSAAAPPMLLTVEETATELRIARRRIYEMIASGELPSVKIGKSRRVRRDDLAAYVAGLGTDGSAGAA